MGKEVRMKGYILSVICICIVGSLFQILAPDGEGGGIGRVYRLIIGICIVLVCIYPMKSIINYIKDIEIPSVDHSTQYEQEEYESILGSSYHAAEKQNLKDGIKRILDDRFGIDASEVEVSLKLVDMSDDKTGEGMRLERIFITLYGGAIFINTNEIEEYFADLFGCEVVTAIG